MKRLHRADLYCWSWFREPLNIDFNAFAWIRDGGNVVIDPLSVSPHDTAHLAELGGVAWVVLTNSDHVRGARELVTRFGARVAGPAAERASFPIACDLWLDEGDEPFPGLRVHTLDGSKTPGELALVLDETTLFAGDLIRSHRANTLTLLAPEQGLKDRARATASIARLLEHRKLETILVADGWHVFQDGWRHLDALVRSLRATNGTRDHA